MQINVLVEALPDGGGFRARAGEPLVMSADGTTVLEAMDALERDIRARLDAGAKLLTIQLGPKPVRIRTTDGLPNDELTREWLEAIEEYRRECDREMEQELEQMERQSA